MVLSDPSEMLTTHVTFFFALQQFYPPGQTVGGATDHVATYDFSSEHLLPVMGSLVRFM